MLTLDNPSEEFFKFIFILVLDISALYKLVIFMFFVRLSYYLRHFPFLQS
jgi:hypothetical protein